MGLLIFGSGGGGGSDADLSLDTIRPEVVLAPYRFHDSKGRPQEGKIPNWNGVVKFGPSLDGNKIMIEPPTGPSQVRHIPAGSYINRDIELEPMDNGVVNVSRTDNKVFVNQQAGYIPSMNRTLTIPAFEDDEPIMPGTEDIVIPTSGKYCLHNITVLGDPALDPDNIRAGFSIFGKAGRFTGAPGYVELSLTPGTNRVWMINTSDYGAPYMFGFIGHATGADQVVSGMGYQGNDTVRTYIAGRGAGNVVTASWYGSGVTLTISDDYSYVFNTSISYAVWIAYDLTERHA